MVRRNEATVTELSMTYTRWGSILAGVFIFFGIQLTLSLLGLGIGIATINPGQEADPAGGLGAGSIIWWTVSSLIALFCGGWVAAHSGGIPRRADGILHGLVMWAVSLVALLFFLGSAAGMLIGGSLSLVNTAMQGVETAQTAQTTTQQAPQTQTPVGETQPGAVTGGPQQETPNIAQEAQRTLQQAGAQIEQFGGEAADRVAGAAALSFFLLLLGGAAAGLGGFLGTPAHVLIEERPVVPERTAARKTSNLR